MVEIKYEDNVPFLQNQWLQPTFRLVFPLPHDACLIVPYSYSYFFLAGKLAGEGWSGKFQALNKYRRP